ncbi:hypothetical protein MASR2M15_29510 [Anaerolineales bacterium]
MVIVSLMTSLGGITILTDRCPYGSRLISSGRRRHWIVATFLSAGVPLRERVAECLRYE